MANDPYNIGSPDGIAINGVPLVRAQLTSGGLGWNDMIGQFVPDEGGANSPTLAVYQGGCREKAYNTNDMCDVRIHVEHWYALGTDVFLHLHWSHNGTAISGQLVVDYSISYSKGHNQANFVTPILPQLVVATPDIATIPQYRHRIDEIQITNVGGDSTHIDRALVEPDGVFLCNVKFSTIPNITGSASLNRPFLHFCDGHAQGDRIATLNKAPNFYA